MAAIARRPSHEADPAPFLLRLYPAVWRARYGDEFEELLAARPPSLRDRVDILLGAVDARINPQLDPNATGETRLPHDRSIGVMLVAAGALLTVWAGGAVQMPRWESGDVVAVPELLAVSYASGMLASFIVLVALLVLAFRYDWSIGSSGAVGAVITGSGIFFAALGGGMLALVMLGGGTLLLTWRMRGRLVGTVAAVSLATTTLLLVAAFVAFATGRGQDVGILWTMLAYGPAWMLVGLDLRCPVRQAEGLVNA